jgi:hypothetical protein
MTQKFEMSMMGELNYFLGFQVKQLKDDTFISQTKYRQDLLKRFGMKDAKPAKTPMGIDRHVDLNKGGKFVDQKTYRSMIGSLLYLCASRPDIMLSVCMCARYQSDPRECHLMVIKRILRYLVSTPCFGIWYPKGSTFDLIGYSDSDYAGCKVDRCSIPKIQILKISQTPSKFKMNFKFRFKMFVCKLISTNNYSSLYSLQNPPQNILQKFP